MNSIVTVSIDGGTLNLKATHTDGTMMDSRQIVKSSAPGSTPTPTPGPTGTPDPGNGNGGSSTVHGSGCDVGDLAGGFASAASGAMALGALALLLRRRAS